jgi:hypothetical protein
VKLSYVVAVLVSIVGVYLLFFGVSDSEHLSVLGMPMHARVAKGVGIISLLLGIIAFMVAYGGSLPPGRAEHRR